MFGIRIRLSISSVPVQYINQPLKINRRCISLKFFNTEEKNKTGVLGYSLLIIPFISGGLASWQGKKWRQKTKLIEELKSKITGPPMELPKNIENIEELEYRRVKIRGVFLYDKEMYIRPRCLLKDGEELMTGDYQYIPQIGAHIVTPFQLSDREETILVNRGWVPRNKIYSKTQAPGVASEVELTGIIRKTESNASLDSTQMTSDGKVFWMLRDISKMASAVNCAPVFVDACVDPNSPLKDVEPIAGQTDVNFTNEHFIPFVTWYSIFTSSIFLWYLKYGLRKL